MNKYSLERYLNWKLKSGNPLRIPEFVDVRQMTLPEHFDWSYEVPADHDHETILRNALERAVEYIGHFPYFDQISHKPGQQVITFLGKELAGSISMTSFPRAPFIRISLIAS